MSRFDDLVTELCPTGVPIKALGEIGSVVRGKRFVKADMIDTGVPCIHYGEIYTKYGVAATNSFSFVSHERAKTLRFAMPGDVILASAGEAIKDIGKSVAWLGASPIAIHDACYAFSSPLDPKFVSYFFASRAFRDQIRQQISSSKISSISTQAVSRARIPVPPRAIQREIVRVLDQFTQLETELEAELEARRLQFEHNRHTLLHLPSAPRVAISELVHGVPSGRNKSRAEGGHYPVYGSTGQIGTTNEPVYDSDALLVARVGANAGRVNSVSGEYDVSDNTLILKPKPDWNVRFAFHQLTAMNLNQYAVGGGQPLITGRLLKSLEVALPTSTEQQELAAVLDKFDALVNDMSFGLPAELAARRKQYEYYRDKLLTFPEAAS